MPLLPPSSRPARFLSTLSLRRATFPGSDLVRDSQFLSTLSLRRATAGREFNVAVLKFLSTLSLRRATFKGAHGHISGDISIHALLAESDKLAHRWAAWYCLFLSTLSLRRATTGTTSAKMPRSDFYPRSPCGERPFIFSCYYNTRIISIHALLAESDRTNKLAFNLISPFLSTLSLRRATAAMGKPTLEIAYFYPRSPCGERHMPFRMPTGGLLFLSTLSLRRATTANRTDPSAILDFYPRSPCGERRGPRWTECHLPRFLSTLSLRRATRVLGFVDPDADISIHALLAESDRHFGFLRPSRVRFLSTLSLRRATGAVHGRGSRLWIFLSTLSLRRATGPILTIIYLTLFLSTLSLRRATLAGPSGPAFLYNFYPRSPCGERLIDEIQLEFNSLISIHALLAESDRTQSQSLFA